MIQPQTTKEALLEAAEDLFIERGYDAVSTRDITQAAKANLASIPYYFGSKAELFVETVKYALSKHSEMCPLVFLKQLKDSERPSEEPLRALIHHFISELLSCESHCITWVMFREILNRDPDTKSMREELVRFFHDDFTLPLKKAVALHIQKINSDLSAQQAMQCAESVIAQCVYFVTHEAFIEHETKHTIRTEAFIKRAADHVFHFSMAAIHHLGKQV